MDALTMTKGLHLNRIYDQLDQRRIDIGARTDVLDQPPDVDIAHAKSPTAGGVARFTSRALFGS